MNLIRAILILLLCVGCQSSKQICVGCQSSKQRESTPVTPQCDPGKAKYYSYSLWDGGSGVAEVKIWSSETNPQREDDNDCELVFHIQYAEPKTKVEEDLLIENFNLNKCSSNWLHFTANDFAGNELPHSHTSSICWGEACP